MALAGAPAARAQDKPPIEPEAVETLRAALERIAGAGSFSYRAEVENDVPLSSGQKIQFTGTLAVAVRRPNRLWSTFDGEQRSTRSYYDGETFTLLNARGNVYARWPAPKLLDELSRTMRANLGFAPPLSPLLRENVATSVLKRISSGFTVGQAVVGGVPCRHLAFRGEKTDWQAWVSEGPEPVLKRIVVTYKREPAAPQYAATFLAWDFAPRLSDADFVFTPPPGVSVFYLPDGYRQEQVKGVTLYRFGETLFKPVFIQGVLAYQVVPAQ